MVLESKCTNFHYCMSVQRLRKVTLMRQKDVKMKRNRKTSLYWKTHVLFYPSGVTCDARLSATITLMETSNSCLQVYFTSFLLMFSDAVLATDWLSRLFWEAVWTEMISEPLVVIVLCSRRRKEKRKQTKQKYKNLHKLKSDQLGVWWSIVE